MTKLQFLDKTSKRSDELLVSIQTIENKMKKTNSLEGLRSLHQDLEIIRLELRFNTEATIDLK